MVESLRGVGELVVLRAICAGYSELFLIAHAYLSLRRMTSSSFVVLRAICADYTKLFITAVSFVCVAARGDCAARHLRGLYEAVHYCRLVCLCRCAG